MLTCVVDRFSLCLPFLGHIGVDSYSVVSYNDKTRLKQYILIGF